MQLETTLGTNTIDRNKICTLICLTKRRYDEFFENNMGNIKKNLARNQ